MTPTFPCTSSRPSAGPGRFVRLFLACFAVISLAAAATPIKKSFDVPADTVDRALKRFSEQAGLEVLFPSEIAKGIRTQAVKGTMTPRDALDGMLIKTGLIVIRDEKTGAFTLLRENDPNAERATPPANGARPRQNNPTGKTAAADEALQTPEPMKGNNLLTRLAAALALSSASAAQAAESVGTIEGRIQNITTGDYLNNARVTIAGTDLTTLTNPFGEYRVADVPAGEVRITVFYTGLPAQTVSVSVGPGQRVVKDIDLKGGMPGGKTIQMDAFTVSASREMSETAIATNEQRFAANMKNVVSAESFGDQSEGNVAEFLKFMPGFFINYVSQDARSANVRGMPAHTTIVTSNGNAVASAPIAADRTFEFEKLTINDAAHIEFNKTLLPDMPAEGIGGTINIVTKSAFHRSRPQTTYRTYFNFNTTRLEIGKTYGVDRSPTYKIIPGFDFTYIKPVNRNFGITIGAAMSSKFNPQYLSTTTWTLNPNAATGAENPFLASFQIQDTPTFTDRYSGRVGLDWRFSENGVLTLGFSEQYYDAVWMGRRWFGSIGATPASFSREFVQGRAGAGSMQFTGNASHKYGTTWQPEFKLVHHGRGWKSELRGAYSRSSTHGRNAEAGHFASMNLTLGSFNAAGALVAPTVRFDLRGNYVPDVTVQSGSGATVNPRDADHFIINSAVDIYREVADVKKSLFLSTQRDLNLRVPLTLKVGGDIRQSIRDLRGNDPAHTFVGADGRAGTRDDAVSAIGQDIFDPYSEVDPPFGLPKFRWPSQYKLYELYLAHPNWWTRDAATEHRQFVENSRYLEETITSGFIRVDGSFFRQRLTVVGGVRFQDYRSHAEAGEVDNLGLYVRDEEGSLVTDSATGQPIRLGGNALQVSERVNIERGVTTKGVVRGFHPSFNAIFRLTENIQLRAGYASSVSYPNLGSLAASTTISDLTTSPRRLMANSPLKPWHGKNYDIDLEYYTAAGGSFTLAYFRKEISDFANQVRHRAGTAAAKAALDKYGYGVLAPYDFEVVEQYNGGEAAFDGWEFALHQSLDIYLPPWARGLTVFYNTSYTSAAKGVSRGNISAASQRLMNWGVSHRRGRFATSLKWNYKPEQKRLVPDPTHRNSRTILDVDFSYRLRPRITIFASGANVTSAPTEQYIYTENTPDYARRRTYNHFGVQCTIGVKGQF